MSYGYRLRTGDLVYGGYVTAEAAIRAAAVAFRAEGMAVDGRVIAVARCDGAAFAEGPQFMRLAAPLEGGVAWQRIL